MSIKVNDVVTKHNLCFKASILYRYYENKEQYVLVQRVTGGMIGNMQSSFNVLLSLVGFFIQFSVLQQYLLPTIFGRPD